MITNLLTSIKEQLEELNYQLKDNNYFQELEKKINVVNENINRTYHENTKLHSIIKEVREYIKGNCILSDTWEELENHQFVPTGRINYKSLSSKKIKDILEILDKENKE